MKTCEAYAALLDLYVDAELTPEEMMEVRQHLELCPECQAYVDDCLQIRAEMPAVADTAVPEGFSGSVMNRIRASKRKSTGWARAALPLAACCAVVLLVQGVLDGRGSSKESAPYAPQAPTAAPSMAADSANMSRLMELPALECAVAAEPEDGNSRDYLDLCDITPKKKSETEESTSADAPAESGVSGAYSEITLSLEETEAYLDGFPPMEESDLEILYCLTGDEYAALLRILEQNGISVEDSLPVPPVSRILVHAVRP